MTSGGVKAEALRIVEVENGIRLLNGSLDLGLNGNDVVINRLHFPSVIRIMPNEWRTRQWIEENPPAQNGSLDISGNWNLQSSRGQVKVLFDHYPILQRTDRFAMMSGEVNVDAALPRIVVDGKVTADAGWASVDIKGTAPTLDSDVVIVRKGEELPQASPSELDLDLSFTVDLGPRFYVVGFGLDAGLVGAITIKQANNALSAEGQFNTRGGAIEAYGQRLQIRRGRIAFQGDIANPVLDIEALRTNLEVEAGMRVVGNARNPKISLISYPEVSEVEKLSWLIMGRGPDSSGGDLAMLLTVGTSLLGGDATQEPIHKQLGIDDISIRKGDVGESGSVLPRRTVGDSTSYLGQNDISEQFLQLTKRLRQGINVSIEQALSGSGTVARVSYTLIRNLTVDAKVGTVSGIEMVYRRFFRD
ncbi:translocation/assembly module TamB domain-containing protein [Oligella ureolytica]